MQSTQMLVRRVGTRPYARIVAISAIVLGLLGVGFVVWGIIDSPLLAFILVLLAPVFLALVFLAVTSEGRRRHFSVLGAIVVGLVVIAVTVLWNIAQEGYRLQGFVGLVLLALAAVASRYALIIPPPTLDEALAVRGERRTVEHPVLIINLKSGGGKAEQFDLVDVCREHGIATRVLEPGVELRDLALDAVRGGADALGMAGGDGSLAYVATVAADHDIPFVCVPAGTRNHFALDLGLDRKDPRQAIAAFISGEEHRISYATINDRMFLNNVSLGVYAAIVSQDSYRDAKVDTTLQMLPKLFNEGGPWFDLQFDVPEHGRLDQAVLLQASNNPYAAAEFGRRSRLDTGLLGMVTADPKRLADLVSLTMLAAAKQAERSSALWSWSADTLRVDSGQAEISAGLDGETVAFRAPLEFRAVPDGLRVLVPRGTRIGLDEQHLGTQGTMAGLLSVALGVNDGDS
jgi:diacylglycerol kinase family enzyme